MANSILALEPGVTDARALRGPGAGTGSGRDSEDFGEVLDDQLLNGEPPALENNVPAVAPPPDAEAKGTPELSQVSGTTPQAGEPVVSPLDSTANTIDIPGLGQATAGAPLTLTQAEALQAISMAATPLAFELNPGSVPGMTRKVAGGLSALVNGLDADTGAVPMAATDQQTSARATALSAAGKFESSDLSLSPAQQILAGEAGQPLAEQRPGAMGNTLLTAPVPSMAPAMQAVSPAVQNPIAAPGVPLSLPALSQPFGDGQWSNAFGQRIAWAVGQGIQTASLALNPAELGPVTVQIAVRDDETHLRFNALQGLTRDAIEAALPRLREMLQAGGLSLGQVDISADAQSWAGHADTQQQGNGPAADSSSQGEDESAPATPVVHYTSRGLVDTFV